MFGLTVQHTVLGISPKKKHLCDISCILEKKSRKLDPKILIHLYSNKLSDRQKELLVMLQ